MMSKAQKVLVARARHLCGSRRAWRDLSPILVLVALLSTIGSLAPGFISLQSLSILAHESSVILLLAVGQTAVVLMGGIDLSVGALASLTSVVIALLAPGEGALAVIAALFLASLIGLVQGLAHARGQLPSFVVTLAGLGLWSGIALTIAPATVPISDGYGTIGWLEQDSFGVSNAFLFGLAVLCLIQVGLSRMPFGRYLYAIGMSERVALMSGIRVWRVKTTAFVLSGTCSGLAGMVIAARTSSGNPTIADSLLLPSIAAVVVGGTAITGGYGGLGRTLVGVLMVAIMRVGLALTGLDPAYEPIVYGALVVFAAALTVNRDAGISVK